MTESLDAQLAALRVERAPIERRSFARIAAVMGAVLAAGLGLAVYVVIDAPETEAAAPARASAPVPVPVSTPAELTATGYLVADRSSEVAAPVAGLVAQVEVHEGDRVERGDVLALLDVRDADAALRAAEARAAAARARIDVLLAREAAIARTLVRERALERAGVTTRVVVEQHEDSARELAAELRAVRADARAADAEGRALAVTLDRHRVLAPFDGLVTAVHAAPGEVASPGTPLATLDDLGALVVEVDVPEARLSAVLVGARCEVVFDALTDTVLRGEVARGPTRIDRAKATASVDVRLFDAPEALRPGMAARVRFFAPTN